MPLNRPLVFTKFTYFSPCFFNLWQNYGKTFQLTARSFDGLTVCTYIFLSLKITLFSEFESS